MSAEKSRPSSSSCSTTSMPKPNDDPGVQAAPVIEPKSEAGMEDNAPVGVGETSTSFNKDYRFWLIMLVLCFAMILSSLESTVVITSLPTIVEKLDLGKNYIWVANVYFLASTAVQPLFGQLSNLFGRRNVMTFIFAAYTLGSGIAGGASDGTLLIVGRTIQGIGSGGLAMGSEVIISDIVPLRYRGTYVAALLLLGTIGYSLGPVIGGLIIERSSWRWVFYLNLPVGAIGMVICYLFLNLKYDRQQPVMAKLKRIDYGGNVILIAASTAVLIALTWGGPVYPWSHVKVVVPLVLGLLGLIGFVVYEASGIPAEPVMPLRLFANRTAQIVYFNTFINSMVNYWVFYFIPLYFQAVQLSSPTRSGVQLLPILLIAMPGAAVSSFVLAKFGKYKYLHIAGFMFLTLGVGILALLDQHSSTAAWVLLQAPASIGAGMLITTLLPSFQASSPEIDQAAATGSWSFMRWFGYVWGVSVAGAIFSTFVKQYASSIDDATAREILSNGDAYASATKEFVMQFPEPVRSQIISVFRRALRQVFLICIAFSALSIITVFFEKDVPLRTELDTAYGLEERKKKGGEVAA